MPENVNIDALECSGFEDGDDGLEIMIDVDHVSMIFNMASEQLNSLKEYAIALARRELRFKEFRALDDISFKVKKGDVLGILGTNGSGKSTLLKIVAGVLEPSKGSCTVNGNIAPLIELGAGFDMELTARENVYLNGALLGYSKKYIDDHFDEIVEFAEVEKFLDMPMKNYSSGMVARIAFAIATVIVPEILIVDEVLSVGDFMFQKKCEDRIMSLINEHGVTVLIVSHNNDQIERLCNKAVWIEKGHLRMEGSAKEVCGTYRVLGGRIGSKESEEVVFKALTSSVEPRKGQVESLTADSRYGMAAKLMTLCYPDGADMVILVSGEHIMDSLLVCGLAGAFDAPVLLMQDDNLPDVTAQTLLRLNPNTILLVDSGSTPKDSVCEMLRQAYGNDVPAVEVISSSNYQDLSMRVYEYGKERSIWGADAVFTFIGCTGDLVSLSPYTFKAKCPIFLKESEDAISQDVYEAIGQGGFKRTLILGGQVSFPDDYLEGFEAQGCEVVRFCGKNHYDANELVNNWIDGNDSSGEPVTEMLVSAIWTPEDACVAGTYAAKYHSRILFNDPQDLDSVAHSIRYIRARKNLEKLVFIGDRARYTDTDKAIVARGLNP